MDALVIQGPCRLEGEVRVSGSKNAALPGPGDARSPFSPRRTGGRRARDDRHPVRVLERLGNAERAQAAATLQRNF